MTFNETNVRRDAQGKFSEKLGSAPDASVLATMNGPEIETRNERLVREFNQRRALLQKAGYAKATAQVAIADVRETARDEEKRADWWEQNFVTGEFAPEKAGSFALMPDDYTPGMTTGRSAEGHRRTHRMLYEGAGVSVRMPSAAAIKRFSADNKNHSFDVPLSIEIDGQQVAGHVRVTKNGPNQWGVSSLGFPANKAERVAEAVSAVLESRRPSTALREVNSLIERRRERLAMAGAKVEPVASSFIDGIGYNEAGNEMFVTMHSEKTGEVRAYAYRVPRDVYHAVRNASSPGRAYNDLVKKGGAEQVAGGKNNPVQVGYDEATNRWYNQARGFRFSRHTAPDKTAKHSRPIALKRVLGIPAQG